jgi:hypothetical protein
MTTQPPQTYSGRTLLAKAGLPTFELRIAAEALGPAIAAIEREAAIAALDQVRAQIDDYSPVAGSYDHGAYGRGEAIAMIDATLRYRKRHE